MQALPKGDRGELAVETMTEVGVDVVVPWAAARCVTRWRADLRGQGAHQVAYVVTNRGQAVEAQLASPR